MADPRITYDYTGIDNVRLPFGIDGVTLIYDPTAAFGHAAAGRAVTLSGDKIVALCADGEFVLGRLEAIESDGTAIVIVDGLVQLPGGNGATLTRGKEIVGALGPASAKGYIREVASATAAELARGRGSLLTSDATSPWVML